MAIPLQSLSGTEVLRRGCINAQSNTNTHLKFNNVAPTTAANTTDGTVPTDFEINDITIVYRGKNVK